MQAIFNELSALTLAEISTENAINALSELLGVCETLQELDSTFKMRINPNFWEIKMNSDTTIMKHLDTDENSAMLNFLYIITDSPNLPDNTTDIFTEKFLEENLFLNDVKIDADSALRTAYAFDPQPAPLISFATANWRQTDTIMLKNNHTNVILLNITTKKQIFETHFADIATKYLPIKTGNPTRLSVSDILPNKDITNIYLDYFQIYQQRATNINSRTLNKEISITEIKTIAKTVALINNWTEHEGYTKINNRLVFKHTKTRSIFIALDTEKADFEVHSSEKNNNHLGAISLDGKKTEYPKGHQLKFNR
jgi:hypothetical protein